MTTSIESQLNEALRDALVAYTLNEVVPNAAQFVSAGLSGQIKTANDLYQYFLIDNQVNNVVKSSPVASAIASVQQYINAALMSMEPGYEIKVMEQHLITQWRDIQSQYPIWAADQQLRYYPEIYIHPQLRMNKSTYFRQLEIDLNQNKITLDTAQEAVKNYLNNFEEVANLSIINGYITTDDFKNGRYYFIGKSRGENQYYWRSVDMFQRSLKNINQPDGPKVDFPQSGAWSDWHKASLPISASAIEHTIRPVYFNNRLFVFWVELIDRHPEALTVETSKPPEPGTSVTTVNVKPMLHMNMVYEKYDGSWSVPHTVIEAWSEAALFKAPGVMALIDSIAVQDSSSSPDSMFVAMYAGYEAGAALNGSQDKYAFLATAFIDRNLIPVRSFPSVGYVPGMETIPDLKKPIVLSLGRLFAEQNKDRLQFRSPRPKIGVKSVETESPNPNHNDWNYGGWQSTKIVDPLKGVDVKVDIETQSLVFESTIKQGFSIAGPGVATEKVISLTTYGTSYQWALVLNISNASPVSREVLLEGSRIEVYSNSPIQRAGLYGFNLDLNGGSPFYGFLMRPDPYGMISFPKLPYGTFPLHGNYVSRPAFEAIGLDWTVGVREISTGFLNSYRVFAMTSNAVIVHRFRHHIMRPSDLNAVTGSRVYLKTSSWSFDRSPPDRQRVSIPIDVQTLLPDWGINWPANSKKIPFIHGVEVNRTDWATVGNVLKVTYVELEILPNVAPLFIAPRLNTRPSPTLGVAEFIDFRGSGIEKTDGSSTVNRQPIRMNTLFARELINKANITLENLLDWRTQLLEEPPLDPPAAHNLMDFRGANGKYFWELFLHLPFLVSQRMYLEQQFDEAERWLGFIFDPARKSDSWGRPDYWNVRSLIEDPDLDAVSRAPADPDGIAESYPVRYRKAVYLHYLKNLLGRGDAAYRQLTPDSLGEAKLWYVRILDLLGPRPDVKLVDHWTPITLQTLANSSSRELRDFEQRLIEQDQLRDDNSPEAPYYFAEPALRLRTFTPDLTLGDLDSGYLRLAFSQELVHTWDLVESRLNNLRNNRTLDGKALSLPLFAAPLNPRDLLAAFGQGAAAGGAGRLLTQGVPPYRFNVMHAAASNAVDTLIQFGQTLLSLIERKEQAQFQELQQQQLWEFARFGIELQTQALKVDEEQRKALEASKAIVQGRLEFYRKLADEGVNSGEQAAAGLHLAGRIADGVAAVANVLGAGLKLPPNAAGGGGGGVGGLCPGIPPTPSAGAFAYASVGGWRLEGVPQMVEAAAYGVATLSHATAESLDRTEQFRRRHQDWIQARDQADLEIAQIDAQLAVLNEQSAANRIQLHQAEFAQEQAKLTYEFLGRRFSNAQLYQWLNGQFATFYYQAYDATLALCLSAQACWQFEIADFTSRFIQTGGWNDSQRGLGAGETLKLQLLKMRSAYLVRNERLLEITKTVSLRQLKAMDDDPALINQDWETMHKALKNGYAINFELSAKMFEDDYPGTSQRRIQRMGVSLPLALGLYENISAILTQSYNAVEMGGSKLENLRPGQQIVLSHGDNDDGQFTGDDERYLPFEGTGSISRWHLAFTEQNPQIRERHIESLQDIILHLSYTAKPGQE